MPTQLRSNLVRRRKPNRLLSHRIDVLYNGVSQQSPSARLSSQFEGQKNIISSIVNNAEKRPPTEFIKQLETSILSTLQGRDVLFHEIKRDATEKYVVLFTPDSAEPILIYSLDGTKMTVNYDTAADRTYCVHQPSVSSNEIRTVTIADYTIIANRGTTVAMNSSLSSSQDPYAYIWIKQSKVNFAAANLRITLNIDGTEDNDTYTQENTNEIASDAISNWSTTFGSFTFTKVGTIDDSNVIKVTKTAGGEFGIRVNDSQGNNAVKVVKGKVTATGDLPPVGVDGDVLEIIGSDGAQTPGFYVKFDDETQRWVETIAPGVKYNIDNTTMPRQMVRGAGNQFDVSKITWDDRLVGDDDTAPEPSFVGQSINDVVFFKNRLGFLSHESTVLSKSGDFFDFFPTTATEVLDDDPIDLSQPLEKVAILRDAITFSDELLLQSDEHQFVLTSNGNVLTPKSATINESTAFEFSDKAQVVKAGASAYFAVENTDFSSIREFFVEPETLVSDAVDITAHVSKYLPRDIKLIASNSNETILVFLSYAAGHRDRIYVYNYFWEGNTKVMSAWNYWDFGEFREVVGCGFYGDELYIVFRDTNDDATADLVLEKIVLKQDVTGTLPQRLYGDRLIDPATHTVTAALSGSAPNQVTTITLPCNDNFDRTPSEDNKQWFAIHKTTGAYLQATRDVATNDDDEIVFQGDIVADKDNYYYLKNSRTEIDLSEFFIRDSNDIPVSVDDISLRTLEVSFINSGAFDVQVTPKNRSSVLHSYTGAIVGLMDLSDPFSVIQDGDERFMIMAKSRGTKIKIISENHHPLRIQSLRYELSPYSRSRSI